MLGKLIKLVMENKVSQSNAKKILEVMFDEDIDPLTYATKNGYIITQIKNAYGKVYRVLKEQKTAVFFSPSIRVEQKKV